MNKLLRNDDFRDLLAILFVIVIYLCIPDFNLSKSFFFTNFMEFKNS